MAQLPTRWYFEHITPSLKLVSELTKILYVGDTKYQHVEVLESVPFGRSLVLDGRTQSSEADEFVYHDHFRGRHLTSWQAAEKLGVMATSDVSPLHNAATNPGNRPFVSTL